MAKLETWTIGEIIKKLREEQKVTLHQLCRGICSSATLSRIEEHDRDMEFIMATVLFERLGYTLDKFECYGSKEEFEQYEKRLLIQSHKENGEIASMEKELKEYVKMVGEKKSVLQEQFIAYMKGFLYYESGDDAKACVCMENAVEKSIPNWNESWSTRTLLSASELDMLVLLANIYERIEKKKKATAVRWEILHDLSKRRECKGQVANIYTEVICQQIPYLINKGRFQESIYWCDQGIQLLSEISRMYHWSDLLYWKAKTLEAMLKSGEATKKQVVLTYQEAYYIHLLCEKEEEAENIKEHLEKTYQWKPI